MRMKLPLLLSIVLCILLCVPLVLAKSSSSVSIKDDSFFRDWRSSKEILEFVDALGKAHKSETQVFSIGKSAEKKPIKVISIGPKEPTFQIFLMGTMHGREWISPMSLCYLAWRLLNKQGPGFETPNSPLASVLKSTKVSILPMLNPDGYEYTRTPASKSEGARMWRKNRRNLCAKCERAAHGIDLNRNWGVDKVTWGFGATRSTSDAYQGKHPFSEPELKAIQGHLTKHGKSIDVFLDVHCCSAAILPPTYYHGESQELIDEHMEFAKAIASSMKAVNKKRYRAREREKEFSNTNSGIGADWIYGEAHVKRVFIVEARGNELSNKMEDVFFMETRQIVPVSQEVEAAFWTSLSRIHGDVDASHEDSEQEDDASPLLEHSAEESSKAAQKASDDSDDSESGLDNNIDLNSLLSEFGNLDSMLPSSKSNNADVLKLGNLGDEGHEDDVQGSLDGNLKQVQSEESNLVSGLDSGNDRNDVDDDQSDSDDTGGDDQNDVDDDQSDSDDTGDDDDKSESDDTGDDDDKSDSDDAGDDDQSDSDDTGDDDQSDSDVTGDDDDQSDSDVTGDDDNQSDSDVTGDGDDQSDVDDDQADSDDTDDDQADNGDENNQPDNDSDEKDLLSDNDDELSDTDDEQDQSGDNNAEEENELDKLTKELLGESGTTKLLRGKPSNVGDSKENDDDLLAEVDALLGPAGRPHQMKPPYLQPHYPIRKPKSTLSSNSLSLVLPGVSLLSICALYFLRKRVMRGRRHAKRTHAN